MKEALHAAISSEVARRLGWPDPEAVGVGARQPDEIEIVGIRLRNGSVVTRVAGNNLSSCTHFAGYNLGMDRSCRRLELPDRELVYLPGSWTDMPLGVDQGDPLWLLLADTRISHSFDELSWPAAWSYADWWTKVYRVAEAESEDYDSIASRERRLGIIAGRCLHYIQDMTIPQHRRNEMLAYHSETEAQVLKRWETMDAKKKEALIVQCIAESPTWSPRGLAQGFMVQATPKVSAWACRRRKLVDQIITKGLCCTAAALKYLRVGKDG